MTGKTFTFCEVKRVEGWKLSWRVHTYTHSLTHTHTHTHTHTYTLTHTHTHTHTHIHSLTYTHSHTHTHTTTPSLTCTHTYRHTHTHSHSHTHSLTYTLTHTYTQTHTHIHTHTHKHTRARTDSHLLGMSRDKALNPHNFITAFAYTKHCQDEVLSWSCDYTQIWMAFQFFLVVFDIRVELINISSTRILKSIPRGPHTCTNNKLARL